MAGFTLPNIQAGFDLFVTRFNTAYPGHTITAPTVASTSQADVQTAFDTLTASINGALSLALISPVIGAFDASLLQACCNGLARNVDKVIAPIVAVLNGLNVGGGAVSTAVHDAIAAHQAVLANLEMLFDTAPEPEGSDAEREALLSRVQSMWP